MSDKKTASQRAMVEQLVESQERLMSDVLGMPVVTESSGRAEEARQAREQFERGLLNPLGSGAAILREVDEVIWAQEVPDRPWVPVVVPREPLNTPRTGATYSAVLDALPLDTSHRYQPRSNFTFCNIYVWDATRLLGCEIPHWVGEEGVPVSVGEGREQTANDMADWLQDFGHRYGWGPCGPAAAQLMASRGNPAVAVWRNPGGTGHVAMVRPGELHPERGPCIAQAGKRNFREGHVLDGFGAGRPVEYYVHLPKETP